MFELPKKMFALPTYRESVDQAVSAGNLKAVAANTTDPEVLLGLAYLARTGDSVRREISEMAVKARPEYSPMVAVLAVMLDGMDEQSIGELVRRDPDNALGYYLQGALLHQSDRESEAMVAFRKAAHCSELRLYESTTGPALFKALDAWKLTGADRLCALSWMASRSSDFSSLGLQPINFALSDMAQNDDNATRQEIPGLLLVLAGHVFATNFRNRWFAKSALESAVFGMKARIVGAGNSQEVNGCAAITQAPVGVMLRWPGIEAGMEEEMSAFRLTQDLPNSIHRAFAFVDPAPRSAAYFDEMNASLHGSAKPRLEKAREKTSAAAKALIDAALTDPDGLLGSYLNGLPTAAQLAEGRPRAPHQNFVKTLMRERPDILKAAAACQAAMNELWDLGVNDLGRRNIGRMMEINFGLHRYASEHENIYPDSIDVLFENGFLKPPLKSKSLHTGRPYVYVAAGEKRPLKLRDSSRFVVLYDDNPSQGGYYECVMANWTGSAIKADELKEQLRKRGKLNT